MGNSPERSLLTTTFPLYDSVDHKNKFLVSYSLNLQISLSVCNF